MAKKVVSPIWAEDGKTLTNALVKDILETYNVTQTWYDGTPMDDTKIDDDLVYIKYEGKYLVRNEKPRGFLEKNTLSELRNLSDEEILLLKRKVYEGVRLNGREVENDIPEPINFNISTTSKSDNDYSIIEVKNIKLEHDFKGKVDIRYVGAKEGGVITSHLKKLATENEIEKITVPTGDFFIDDSISFKPKQSLIGEGNTVFRFAGTYEHGLNFSHESLLELPTISSNITRNSRTIVFSSAPNLQKGDIFFIKNNQDSSYSSWRTYYKQGEYFEVIAVSGNTVTLANTPFSTYSTTDDLTIRKVVNPATGRVQGIKLEGEGSNVNNLLTVSFGKNFEISNIDANEGKSTCVNLKNCYSSRVSRYFANKISSGGFTTDYGLMVSNCQNINISNCDILSVRHAIAIGGDNSIGAIVNRNIKIHNSILRATNTVYAADSHGNAEYIEYVGCTLWGAVLRGNHIKLLNNTIFAVREAIVAGEMKGTDFTIKNNDIYSYIDIEVNQGVIFNCGGTATAFDEKTTEGGTIDFSNNKIHIESTATNLLAVAIHNRGCNQKINVNVDNNTTYVKQENAVGIKAGAFVSIQNYNSASMQPFEKVSIKGNNIDGGIYTKNTRILSISDNTLGNSSGYGIFSEVTEDTKENYLINVTDNTIKNTSLNSVLIRGTVSNKIKNVFIKNNIFDENNKSASSTYKCHIYLANIDLLKLENNIGLNSPANQTDKAILNNITTTSLLNNDFSGNGDILQPFTEKNNSSVNSLDNYGYRIDENGDFNTVGYSPVLLSVPALNSPPSFTGVTRWWTFKQKTDHQNRHYQIAISNAVASGALPLMAFRVLNPSLGPNQYTPWVILGANATPTSKGLVNQASFLAEGATVEQIRQALIDANLMASS